jgi:hypothetical protein
MATIVPSADARGVRQTADEQAINQILDVIQHLSAMPDEPFVLVGEDLQRGAIRTVLLLDGDVEAEET